MAMGWGCNAAAIVSTRIIDSPRERLIAIITNNFALCNGRWPTQILIASIFIGGLAPAYLAGLISAWRWSASRCLGVVLTFATSWLLSRTVLRGEVSTFNLELPPYRPPRILQTIYTSMIDRTLVVLWRAVIFALPAGAVIWLLSNIQARGRQPGAPHHRSHPTLRLVVGLSGIILLAYIIAIPANEIVIPTILMLTVLVTGVEGVGAGAGVMFELDSGGHDRTAAGRGLHAADGRQPDALQPCPQPLLDDDLHDLQGDPQRQVDHGLGAAASRHGLRALLHRDPDLAHRRWLLTHSRRSPNTL